MAEEFATENGTTVVMAKNYTGDQSITDAKAQDLLEDAHDWLVSLAPPPDPITDDYRNKGRRTELRIYEYLSSGAALISSTGVGPLSKSYSNSAKDNITAIVQQVMSEYVVTEELSDSANTAYVGKVFW